MFLGVDCVSAVFQYGHLVFDRDLGVIPEGIADAKVGKPAVDYVWAGTSKIAWCGALLCVAFTQALPAGVTAAGGVG